MERVKTLSLVIFLILIIGCEAAFETLLLSTEDKSKDKSRTRNRAIQSYTYDLLVKWYSYEKRASRNYRFLAHRSGGVKSNCFLIHNSEGVKGLDTNSGKGPTLSGVKNQKFDIFTAPPLTSLQQMIAQSFIDLQDKLEDRLSTLELVLYDKIDRLDSKTKNRFSTFQDNTYDKIDALENRIKDQFKFIDDKIQVYTNAGNSSFESKIDDKFRQFQVNLTKRTDACEMKFDVKIRNLQSHLAGKADALENLLDIKLKTLQDKIDIKLDNQNISNRMILLEDKISNELEECRTDKNTDIFNHLEAMLQRSDDIQNTNLENFSEAIEDNMNKTFDYLINISSAFESCKALGEINSKNHTEGTTDAQTSGGNATLSLPKDANITAMDSLRSTCQRGMANDTTKKYQRLELMRDNTLSRDILCDTETDGGGWIMIQRRTKGDVDFYRTWEEYKNGFCSPPGDFWLGNEAIHNLTSQGSYELRIDFNDGSQDLFAVYSSFQLEDETDNYRLRLGSHSGTLGEGSLPYGLSYHNGSQFSTHDKDNNNLSGNCAELYHGAWWYRGCATSNLNGKWGKHYSRGLRWYTGSTTLYASSTEMKIRLI